MEQETASDAEIDALITELEILMHVGSHLNIVNLLGAVTENIEQGKLYVIVEYCCYGNMRQFLQTFKESFVDQLDHRTGEIEYSVRTALPALKREDNRVLYTNFPNGEVEYPGCREEIAQSHDISTHGICDNSDVSFSTDPTDISSSSSTMPSIFRRKRHKSYSYERKENITTSDLLSFSFQSARGMEYLASKKLIHRDLAARNVLLSKNYIVKICDFGMSKNCCEYSIYKKKRGGLIPIRWTAPESIKYGIYTTKSDVWSFGVLLWEIFALGDTPYSEENMNEQFVKKLFEGYRMKCPYLAPEKIYQVMQQCWQVDANQRPDFSWLVDNIGSLIESTLKKYYMDLNKPYEVMNEEMTKEKEKLQIHHSSQSNINDERNETSKVISLNFGDVEAALV